MPSFAGGQQIFCSSEPQELYDAVTEIDPDGQLPVQALGLQRAPPRGLGGILAELEAKHQVRDDPAAALLAAQQQRAASGSLSGASGRGGAPPVHYPLQRLKLKLASLADLQQMLGELRISEAHTGLDDVFNAGFSTRRTLEGTRLLRAGSDTADLLRFMRYGCPQGLRANMWAAVLDLPHIGLPQLLRKAGVEAGGNGTATSPAPSGRSVT